MGTLYCCNVILGFLLSVDFIIRSAGTGNENTSVRNFSCVWYYEEYVNCTWKAGQDTPPNVHFIFQYWVESESETVPTKFSDLLDTGEPCQKYFPSDGVNLGCQFKFQQSSLNIKNLLMVVSDRSKTIKPFIFHTDSRDIAKLRPPTIIDAHRTANRSIYVQWNVSQNHNKLDYEVLFNMSSSEKGEIFPLAEVFHTELRNVLPEVTYKVKVRVKLSLTYIQWLWSDWSEETILPGDDSGTTTSTVLLIVIPIIVVVAAIILLICLKRLKIIICPSIPDPGKMFPSDLQEWLKSERPNSHHKPEKEEVCPVSLLEYSLPSSQIS
ncbi:interleukin-13 receptor subunit alpha-1-like isoform X2 [Mixophyes fleayi]|uniref:interleukin-13 receptor subunit alpha-1-like isoform X2 n=1 Tax=Mixophyes fleayi TaxID=3061075 RepID=UPI003F4E10B6